MSKRSNGVICVLFFFTVQLSRCILCGYYHVNVDDRSSAHIPTWLMALVLFHVLTAIKTIEYSFFLLLNSKHIYKQLLFLNVVKKFPSILVCLDQSISYI